MMVVELAVVLIAVRLVTVYGVVCVFKMEEYNGLGTNKDHFVCE